VLRRRTFIKLSASAALPAPMSAGVSGALARDDPIRPRGDGVVWKTTVLPHPGIPSLNGHTDTIPDIVGRLGAPIDLAIFTEGNHFPALLGGEIIEPFRVWALGAAGICRARTW
jgi:hypothetical protein